MCARVGGPVNAFHQTWNPSANAQTRNRTRAGASRNAQPHAQSRNSIHTMTQEKKAMRELMPVTAEWIDQLRAELGEEKADAIVRKGMQGKGGFWTRETGPDGVVREFGSKGR